MCRLERLQGRFSKSPRRRGLIPLSMPTVWQSDTALIGEGPPEIKVVSHLMNSLEIIENY